MKQFYNYKFRCSGLGNIITKTQKITEKQAETIEAYEAKKREGKITEKQAETLSDLIEKRDSPDELPQGAKTYCDDIFRKEVYGRERIDLSNKFTEKGNLCEQDSFDLMSKVKGEFFTSFKKHQENSFIKGTPDVVKDGIVYDIKSKWDLKTFDESDLTHLYEWQLKGYCYLLGLKKAELVCTLVNAPYHLIENEIKSLYFKMGCPGEDNETYLEKSRQIEINMIFDRESFKLDHTYYDFLNHEWNFDIAPERRIKTFSVELESDDIELIQSRVTLARNYLNEKLKSETN